LPLADHLLRCPECAAFFERSRSLDRRLAATEPSPRGLAAPAWSAVPAREAAPASSPARPLRRLLPLAATLLLAAGGFALGRASWNAVSSRPQSPMTEARFVGITRELLDSPPRYRQEMLRVMAEVSERRPLEGTVDRRPRAEAPEATPVEGATRPVAPRS
jgi:hypothetical protein